MTDTTSTTLDPRLRRQSRLRLSPAVLLLGLAVLLALLSAIRVLTGEGNLTSSGTVNAALGLAVPIGMAGLGGLWAERAGVVNIGLEGMLILGTWFGAWAGFTWGPWAGVLAGVMGGALGGLLHAVATVSFGVDHIISGVAIILLAQGATRYLSAEIFTGLEGGGSTQSPRLGDIGTLTVAGVSDAARSVEARGWFLVSDLAAVVGGLTTQVSLLTILAVALIPLSYYLLWRTAFGLRLRACGENPVAAESLGIDVYRMKYVAVVASGAFAGLGGAFLSIVAASIYREGQTGGRGFIGLAAMIFGNWRPGGLAAGAALFGYTDALQLRGGQSVHALLLLVVVLLVAAAGWSALRRRPRAAAVAAAFAVAVLVWYLSVDAVPGPFTSFAPHLTTLLVLSLAAQRLRMPAADGQAYRRGQGA
jgi:general nucleoside transport system permease protein